MKARTKAKHEEARRLRKLGLPSKGVASRLATTPSEVSRWLRKYDDVPHARFFTREEDLALIAGLDALSEQLRWPVASLVKRAQTMITYSKQIAKAEALAAEKLAEGLEKNAQDKGRNEGR